MHASNPETAYSAGSWDWTQARLSDNRFRLSAHCANEPQRQAVIQVRLDHSNKCLMIKISYANCLGLSSVISAQFTLEMCEIVKNLLKTRLWGVKIVQGHRCWYPRKARQQCALW